MKRGTALAAFFDGDEDPEARRSLRRVQAWILLMVLVLVQVLGLLQGGSMAEGWAWPEVLRLAVFLVHAAGVHLGFLLLLGAAVAWKVDFRPLAVASLLGAGLFLLPSAVDLMPGTAPEAAGPVLRIRSANILKLGKPSPALVEELLSGSEDVLILIEYSQAWNDALEEALSSRLPIRYRVVREDSFGIAVYAREEVVRGSIQRIHLGPDRLPQLEVPLSIGGEPVTLLAVHTLPPRKLDYFQMHRVMVRGLFERLDEAEGPVIVAGDLNFGLNTPQHRGLIGRGFRDSATRAGCGLASTWPVLGPLRYLPGLRLDHVYVGPGLDVSACGTGEGQGSDHRPIMAEVFLER